MTIAVDTGSVPHDDDPMAAAMLIPGAREPGALTTFRAAVRSVAAPAGATTMDAATIGDRQREGGGAPSQRRGAGERSWKGRV